jgi:hypothetical protein
MSALDAVFCAPGMQWLEGCDEDEKVPFDQSASSAENGSG